MKKVLSAVMVIFAVMALSSCAKSYDEQQSIATANAKQIYVAVNSALKDDPNIQVTRDYVYNMAEGVVNVSFDGTNVTDLGEWLGNNYKGYYYVKLNPEKHTVKYALWSDHSIDLDYYEYVDYTDRAYFDGTEHAIGYWG